MTRAAGSPRRWSPLDLNPFALEYLDEPDQLTESPSYLINRVTPMTAVSCRWADNARGWPARLTYGSW